MPARRAAPARRIPSRQPSLDTHGCSYVTPGEGRLVLGESGRDLFAGLDQALHRSHRFLEHGFFGAGELDFDDAFDALGANHHRYADIEILDAVFAVEPGGARQPAFLVE